MELSHPDVVLEICIQATIWNINNRCLHWLQSMDSRVHASFTVASKQKSVVQVLIALGKQENQMKKK